MSTTTRIGINGVAHVIFRVNRIEEFGGRTALALRRDEAEHAGAAHAPGRPRQS